MKMKILITGGAGFIGSHIAEELLKSKKGDVVILVGRDGKNEISADEIAEKIGTINYEVVSRINPLIKRVVR